MKKHLLPSLFVVLSPLLSGGIGAQTPANPSPEFNDITIKPITQRPCLLMDPADLPEVKRRFEAMPKTEGMDAGKTDLTLHALLSDSNDEKKAATEEFVRAFRKVFSGPGKNPLWKERRVNELLYKYDTIASFGFLTEEENKEFENNAVEFAKYEIGDDPSKFPSPQSPSTNNTLEFPTGFATCNRWPDRFLGAALVGLNFPDQPLAKDWVKYACQQIRFMLEKGNWDGTWNEVPRYHNWTLMLFSTLFEAIQRRTGVDFYQDPNTKALLDWYVRFSSPLVRFPETSKRNPKGEPTTPVWGDSNYGPMFQACAIFAPHYATNDPTFSKRLMWMWRRAGSKYQIGWQFNLIFPMLVDPSLPDAPQTLGAAFSKRPGYVALRSGFDTPEETWVTMRGGAARNHKRDDLGSIDIFSHGIPLACGAQSGPYQEPELLWNRWRGANNSVGFVSTDTNVSPSKNPYVDIPGLQSVSSGTPLAFFSSPTVDYTVTDGSRLRGKETFKWVRHLVLVKDPAYLLVWDQCDSTMAAKWFLHTTAAEFLWEENAVTSKTAYGVDLDIHVLSPATPLTPNVKEGPFGGWKYADTRNANKPSGPYPFRMLKYFVLDAAPNTDFVTVLQPRKADAPKLTTKLVSQSKSQIVVSVTIADRTDLITLTPKGGTYQRGDAKPVDLPMTVPESVEPGAEISSHSPLLEHLAATTTRRNPFLHTTNLKENNNP